jgi:methylated-DNA-[protein]-cysteine S-methyltransferase
VNGFVDVGSPLGRVRVEATQDAVTGIRFLDDTAAPTPPDAGFAVLHEAALQIRAYFAGTLREFDLPIETSGTPFQREVWEALRDIPYGVVWTYGHLAASIGRPGAGRAVGAANGSNPLPVLIPCHRVVGADGQLTGYGGGLPRKRALLELEGVRGSHVSVNPRVAPLQRSLF